MLDMTKNDMKAVGVCVRDVENRDGEGLIQGSSTSNSWKKSEREEEE
jgi:hypothetical protein